VTAQETPSRPLLRYHGGKWNLADWIISHFPPHRVYVEPYGGAASVLLSKERSYGEVYNDLDGEIVNLFRMVREHPKRLMRMLAWTPFSRNEYRNAFEIVEDPVEMARRMIIRSFMGFGSNAINRAVKSGFRANSNRSGTTPAHDWANYPPNVRRIARRLRGVVIENRPAAEIIAQHDSSETLFYLDPPYVHATRALDIMHGDHGYAHEMSNDEHRTLAEQLRGVGGMVVLSGYHGELYDELYEGWERVERGALADGASPRIEVLWLNATAWKALEASREQHTLFDGAAA
jgi:DNA adenine methylase